MDMKLSDFLKLNNPIDTILSSENKLLAESGLDTYSRYFTYKVIMTRQEIVAMKMERSLQKS